MSTRWLATTRLVVRRQVVTERRLVEVELRREEPMTDEVPVAAPGAGPEPDQPRLPIVLPLHREVPVVTVRSEP